jgi:spermidine/putrescine transport system permease protein
MSRGRHLGLALWTGVMLAFSLGPLVTIAIFSFNSSRFYAFPIKGLTLKWYVQLFSDERIGPALWSSIAIAGGVTILATLVGTSFAFVVVRARFRGQRIVKVVGFLPLVTPVLVLAAALQVGFVSLELPLGYGTVILGHTVYVTPFVVLTVVAQLYRYDIRIDAAARDLGASLYQMLRHVTLPILWPGIRSGALLAFLLSFNEWAVAYFTGRGFNTLPMLIYSMQRVGLPPTVLAYSSLTVALVLAAVCMFLPFGTRLVRDGRAP